MWLTGGVSSCAVSWTDDGWRRRRQHVYCRQVRTSCQARSPVYTGYMFHVLCRALRHTHTHTQPFNGLWSGTTQVGWYQKKHSPTHTHPDQWTSFINYLTASWVIQNLKCQRLKHTHTLLFNGPSSVTTRLPGWAGTRRNIHPLTHPDHWTSFINFLHLLRSIASSLFIYMLGPFTCSPFRQPLSRSSFGLEPCTLYSMHFFKGPLNGCVCVCVCVCAFLHPIIILSQHMPIP